jgi:hypothetical protein
MPDNWIKNQLQKIKEEKFPPNDLYLSYICTIIIYLVKRKKLKDLLFCQKTCAFPNKKNNKRTELYYIGKYIFQKYDDYCLIITQKKKIHSNKWRLCEDIEMFIRKYVSKFKTGLDPTLIIQSELDDIKDIKSLIIDFLEYIFDIKNKKENTSNLFINYCFIDKEIISKNEGNKEGGNEDNLADVKEGIDNDSNDSECYEEEKEFGDQPEEKKDINKNEGKDDNDIKLYNVDYTYNKKEYKIGKRNYLSVKNPIEELYKIIPFSGPKFKEKN